MLTQSGQFGREQITGSSRAYGARPLAGSDALAVHLHHREEASLAGPMVSVNIPKALILTACQGLLFMTPAKSLEPYLRASTLGARVWSR